MTSATSTEREASGGPASSNSQVLAAFAASLERARTFNVAMDILQDVGEKLGYGLTDYAFSSAVRLPDGSWLPTKLTTRNFPLNWDSDWDKHSPHDPFVHFSICGDAVNWQDVIQAAETLSQKERDCLYYICDSVVGDGITVPAMTFGNQYASISFMGQRSDESRYCKSEVAELAMITNYFHNTVQSRFVLNRPGNIVDLSTRETEALSWCAHGKCIEDIAVLMEISSETVRIYLKRANQKLNAVNRSHAVSKAILLGMIRAPQLS